LSAGSQVYAGAGRRRPVVEQRNGRTVSPVGSAGARGVVAATSQALLQVAVYRWQVVVPAVARQARPILCVAGKAGGRQAGQAGRQPQAGR